MNKLEKMVYWQQGLVCGTVYHRIYATKTQFSELQAPARNSLVYCWPQRNVNNYLLRYRNTLTYLLTVYTT